MVQAAMGFLVIVVGDPLVDDLAQGGDSHYRMLGRIVIVLLEDVAERGARCAVTHAFVQRPHEAFDLALVPRRFTRSVDDLGADAITGLLQTPAVKFQSVIDHQFLHDAECLPVVTDTRVIFLEGYLRHERMPETAGHRQIAGRLEADVDAEYAACMAVDADRDPGTPERQEILIQYEQIELGVIDLSCFQAFLGDDVIEFGAEFTDGCCPSVTGGIAVEGRHAVDDGFDQPARRQLQLVIVRPLLVLIVDGRLRMFQGGSNGMPRPCHINVVDLVRDNLQHFLWVSVIPVAFVLMLLNQGMHIITVGDITFPPAQHRDPVRRGARLLRLLPDLGDGLLDQDLRRWQILHRLDIEAPYLG